MIAIEVHISIILSNVLPLQISFHIVSCTSPNITLPVCCGKYSPVYFFVLDIAWYLIVF